MNSKELQEFINEYDIDATILPMDIHTPTVADAARALKVDSDQIIKSLVFIAGGVPLLVINNGTARVDRRKLGRQLAINRKKVKFANAEQALEITGFVVGSMPPFGHKQKLRTLVDPDVLRLETIYGGGGAIDAMLRLTPQELLRVTEAEIIEVSE